MMDRVHDEAFLGMIEFIGYFIDLRPEGEGFMPVCGCGHDMGEHGAVLLKHDAWVVKCAECLSKEPGDDRQEFDISEVITLTLAKYGKSIAKQEDGDGWQIQWDNPGNSIS